jgi:hypothetical protein
MSARFARAPAATAVAAAVLAIQAVWSTAAEAQPSPRDQFLLPPAGGTWATFDAYTVGVQAQLEHRHIIRSEDYAAIIPRASAIASLGFGELGAHLDLRLLFFSAGISGGVRRVWRGYTFPNTVSGTRTLRRERDEAGTQDAFFAPFGEIRSRVGLPLHDNVLGVFGASLRLDDTPDNTFDWAVTTMRDGGVMGRFDATLFVRSERYGAIGPTLRVLEHERRGAFVSDLAFGFVGGRRLGLLGNNDLLLLNVLTQPTSEEFGFHVLRLPLFTLLVYRVGLPL